MFCTNCGATVVPGQKFCNKCGSPVDAGSVNVNNAMPQQMQAQPQVPVQPQMQAQSQIKAQPQMQAPVQPQNPAQPKKPAQSKKKGKLPVILIILAFALLCAIGLAFAGYTAFMTINSVNSGKVDEVIDQDVVVEDDTAPDVDTVDPAVDFTTDSDAASVVYAYADVYDMGDSVRIVPNNTVNDDTVIWNDKTIGGFCDFVDSEVLSEGNKIDRDLLYQLVAIHVIDPSIVSDDHVFEILMKYCVVVCNEFGNTGAAFNEASFNKEAPNTYVYSVEVNGKSSNWTIDYDEQKVLLNDGKTEYSSAGEFGMFAEKTMASWTYIIDQYFGIY